MCPLPILPPGVFNLPRKPETVIELLNRAIQGRNLTVRNISDFEEGIEKYEALRRYLDDARNLRTQDAWLLAMHLEVLSCEPCHIFRYGAVSQQHSSMFHDETRECLLELLRGSARHRKKRTDVPFLVQGLAMERCASFDFVLASTFVVLILLF